MTTKQIQALLVYLGYDPGEVDGIPGRNTRRSVLAFQAAEGLTQDGSPGPLTRAALLDAVEAGRFRAEDAQTPEETTGTFWDEIRYFKREEKGIACPCGRCGGFPVEPTERPWILTAQNPAKRRLKLACPGKRPPVKSDIGTA